MDPHYFEKKVDLETFIEQVKLVRKVAKSEPFASLVGMLHPSVLHAFASPCQ